MLSHGAGAAADVHAHAGPDRLLELLHGDGIDLVDAAQAEALLRRHRYRALVPDVLADEVLVQACDDEAFSDDDGLGAVAGLLVVDPELLGHVGVGCVEHRAVLQLPGV